MKLEKMENRVFGCSEFSDVVFNSSLGLLEKILDHILEDQYVEGAETMRIGFYANEASRSLDVMVECFEDNQLYEERFKDYYQPKYMRDPIDYYLTHKVVPKVVRYSVGIYPILNGVFIDHSPILFEKGDHLDMKYYIQRGGVVDFNTYMKFLHEAYKSDSLNMNNEFAGTWSFTP